jgi:membrane-associated phospholipid phosphatase
LDLRIKRWSEAVETPRERLRHAIALREQLARHYADVAIPNHISNGDDERYATENYFASFTKGLPHVGPLGEVDPTAYRVLLKALRSGAHEDFAIVPEGSINPTDPARQTFVDPQAGLAFDLEGIDSHLLTMPPAYEFSSAGQIGEIAENYWLALCRDVAFFDYAGNATIQLAAADLSQYGVFDGPRDPASGAVTPDTIFRAPFTGALLGPYLSQFLLLDVPYGSERFEQKVAYALPGTQDYLTTVTAWLDAQNGGNPGPMPTLVAPANQRYMYRGRELAQYVHIDELFQAYLNACLILISPPARGGLGAPLNPGNPYPGSNQAGFGTLGEPNFKGMVAEVATRALKAVWFQKWFVHRRLRPEVFAARIHHWMSDTSGAVAKYHFDRAEFTKLGAPPVPGPAIPNSLLSRVFQRNATTNAPAPGTFLLPMAFPEGSPVHPSYGAGHATVAGACVTVLKAIFDGDAPIQPLLKTASRASGGNWDVVIPNANGTNLVNYPNPAQAARMTVGGELDKLAANIGIARNFAGVHWRSDDIESLRLGEQVALEFLRETVMTYNEDVYFRLKLFDGSTKTITKTES